MIYIPITVTSDQFEPFLHPHQRPTHKQCGICANGNLPNFPLKKYRKCWRREKWSRSLARRSEKRCGWRLREIRWKMNPKKHYIKNSKDNITPHHLIFPHRRTPRRDSKWYIYQLPLPLTNLNLSFTPPTDRNTSNVVSVQMVTCPTSPSKNIGSIDQGKNEAAALPGYQKAASLRKLGE